MVFLPERTGNAGRRALAPSACPASKTPALWPPRLGCRLPTPGFSRIRRFQGPLLTRSRWAPQAGPTCGFCTWEGAPCRLGRLLLCGLGGWAIWGPQTPDKLLSHRRQNFSQSQSQLAAENGKLFPVTAASHVVSGAMLQYEEEVNAS